MILSLSCGGSFLQKQPISVYQGVVNLATDWFESADKEMSNYGFIILWNLAENEVTHNHSVFERRGVPRLVMEMFRKEPTNPNEWKPWLDGEDKSRSKGSFALNFLMNYSRNPAAAAVLRESGLVQLVEPLLQYTSTSAGLKAAFILAFLVGNEESSSSSSSSSHSSSN